MNALNSVRATIKDFKLFDQNAHLLVAVSGGADSTALCFLLKELHYTFGIAHVNFNLRGSASIEDAEFVKKLAKEMNVSYHGHDCDCAKEAKQAQSSIQETARSIRYQFFQEVLDKTDYNYILTAHHSGDNSETILYTIIKGARLSGLRGIQLKRDNIVRPLLYTSKQSIDDYLKENHIEFRVDQSNLETKYRRNFLRHEVIPLIKEINPNIEATLANTALLGSEYLNWINEMIQTDRNSLIVDGILDLSSHQASTFRLAWLYEAIHSLGYNLEDCKNIWAALDHQHHTGKTFLAHGNKLTLDRYKLIYAPFKKSKQFQEYTITSPESCFMDTEGKLQMATGKSVVKETLRVTLDATAFVFPLKLRLWQPGDTFTPYGMAGQHKKLNAFLKDTHLISAEKKDVWVLVSGDEIAWVLGYRASENFKISDSTNKILEISIQDKSLLPKSLLAGDSR